MPVSPFLAHLPFGWLHAGQPTANFSLSHTYIYIYRHPISITGQSVSLGPWPKLCMYYFVILSVFHPGFWWRGTLNPRVRVVGPGFHERISANYWWSHHVAQPSWWRSSGLLWSGSKRCHTSSHNMLPANSFYAAWTASWFVRIILRWDSQVQDPTSDFQNWNWNLICFLKNWTQNWVPFNIMIQQLPAH